MKQLICILICASLCLAVPAAGPAPGDPDPVARELAGIRESLDRLAVVLLEAKAGQKAQLLLRRIERKEVRLAGLESRLRSARSSKSNEEEQLVQMEQYRAQFDEELRAARDRGDMAQEGEADRLARQIELEESSLKVRIERLEAQILELEDQVAEGREAIEDLDLRLEEILALMDESD